jgi:Transmembrane protein 131-like N-terminal/Abnormal spindle-like microcephaly-assoc'd, ASPM-SPD-2-Hydin
MRGITSLRYPCVWLSRRTPLSDLVLLAGVLCSSAWLSGCASLSAEDAKAADAAKISVVPSSIDFKEVVVGQKNSQTLQISNIGVKPLSLDGVRVTGQSFTLSAGKTPPVLASGKSLRLTLLFAPLTSASAEGSLVITSSDLHLPVVVPLAGSGEKAAPALQLLPSSLNFGSLPVHSSSTQTVTLKNTGNVPLSLSSITSPSAAFSITGLSSGTTLQPDQKLEFKVTFHPAASGASSSGVAIGSSRLPSPVKLALSGSGSNANTASAPPPAVHSVSLNWDASAGPVAGYHVYRGSSSGGPYGRISGSTVSSLDYQDFSVQSGGRYYYVVTSVDPGGAESAYSNEAQAEVPNP